MDGKTGCCAELVVFVQTQLGNVQTIRALFRLTNAKVSHDLQHTPWKIVKETNSVKVLVQILFCELKMSAVGWTTTGI
jgi:hypothetical protein